MTAVGHFLERIESDEPTPGIKEKLRVRKPVVSNEPALTARQKQVAQLVACGLKNDEVAYRLGIALKTAEKHRQAALEYFGAHNGSALTIRALQHRLITLEQAVAFLDAKKVEKSS